MPREAPTSPDKKQRKDVGDLDEQQVLTLAVEHLDLSAGNFSLAFLPVEHLLEFQGACAFFHPGIVVDG